MMLLKQFIRSIIDSEIIIDAFALDIGVIAVPVYDRILKVTYGYSKAAEGPCAGGIDFSQLRQILTVQNKRLQLIPSASYSTSTQL